MPTPAEVAEKATTEQAPAPEAKAETAPVAKKIEVDESEYTRLVKETKQKKADAFALRHAQDEKTKAEQRALQAEERLASLPPEDADRLELATKVATSERKRLEAERRLEEMIAATEMSKSVGELATTYNLDPEIFVGCKTPAEAKLRAYEEREKQREREAHTPKNIDTGKGSFSDGSYEAIRDAYIKDPNNPKVYAKYMAAREAKGLSRAR